MIGAAVGWAASIIARTDSQRGVIRNVAIGSSGSVCGWFLSPFLGVSTVTQDRFDMPVLLVSLLGAVILLGMTSVLRRGLVRWRAS